MKHLIVLSGLLLSSLPLYAGSVGRATDEVLFVLLVLSVFALIIGLHALKNYLLTLFEKYFSFLDDYMDT